MEIEIGDSLAAVLKLGLWLWFLKGIFMDYKS